MTADTPKSLQIKQVKDKKRVKGKIIKKKTLLVFLNLWQSDQHCDQNSRNPSEPKYEAICNSATVDRSKYLCEQLTLPLLSSYIAFYPFNVPSDK